MREWSFAVKEGGDLVIFDSGDDARSEVVNFSDLCEEIKETRDARALIEGLMRIQDKVGEMLLEMVSP